MKNSEKYERAFNFFKKGYTHKMGGNQTVILPNGKSKFFDDREYYQGRGTKYNASIKHDIIGEVRVSKKEYSNFLKRIKEQKIQRAEILKQRKESQIKISEAEEKGIYHIEDNGHVLLSNNETVSKYFDTKRLAKTLSVSIEDCELLNSEGKTYVFAKSTTGIIYQLYHSSFDCNDLNIWIKEVTEEYVNSFDHKEWMSAPFAKMVGMTENPNHFAC